MDYRLGLLEADSATGFMRITERKVLIFKFRRRSWSIVLAPMNSEDYRGSRLAFSRINRATSPQLLLFSPRAVSRFFLFFLSADLVRRIVSSSSFSSTFQRPSQPLRFATAIISRSRRERSALRGGPLVKNRLGVYSATESQARIKEEEIRRDA